MGTLCRRNRVLCPNNKMWHSLQSHELLILNKGRKITPSHLPTGSPICAYPNLLNTDGCRYMLNSEYTDMFKILRFGSDMVTPSGMFK